MDGMDGEAYTFELVQAVAQHEKRRVEELLGDPELALAAINWQDFLGWTPLTYAAFHGDFELVKLLVHRGAVVNHLSVSREGSTADGTSALHSCAAMKFAGQVAPDHYYETARVLMLAGGNPYQENVSGLTPIEVAANQGNSQMKVLLEGCCIWKGTLAFKVPRMFGNKTKDRFCLVQPRYPWYEDGQLGLSMSQGLPTFSLVCYKAAAEAKPVTVVPLENARLVVETGGVTEAGILFVKASAKLLKNVALKEVQNRQCVIGIKARGSPSQPANLALLTLAEALKTLNAAAYTGSLGHFCQAGMAQALHNLGLNKSLLAYPGSAPEDDDSAATAKPSRKSVAAARKSLAAGEGVPESIAEEDEAGGGRKSLSLSSIRKSFMRRLSVGEKPQRQSMALQRPAEQPSVGRISEETPEGVHVSPDAPPKEERRKSLSIFSRRKSLQKGEAVEANGRRSMQLPASKPLPPRAVQELAGKPSIPLAFFAPFRDELLQQSLNRQTSTRELPTELFPAQTPGITSALPAHAVPPRTSLDIGDFDEPGSTLARMQREGSGEHRQSVSAGPPKRPGSARGGVHDWVQLAAEKYADGSYEAWKQPPASGAAGPTELPEELEEPDAKPQAARDAVMATAPEAPLPEVPATPPLRQKERSAAVSGSLMQTAPVSVDTVRGKPARPLQEANSVPGLRTPNERSERSRSSVKAPPPARSRRGNNKEMFGSSCAPDDLFHWSLRPERGTRGFMPPPKIVPKSAKRELIPMAPPPQPLQTEPAQQLLLTEDNIAELAASGWTKEGSDDTPPAVPPLATELPVAAGSVLGARPARKSSKKAPTKTFGGSSHKAAAVQQSPESITAPDPTPPMAAVTASPAAAAADSIATAAPTSSQGHEDGRDTRAGTARHKSGGQDIGAIEYEEEPAIASATGAEAPLRA